MCLLACICAAGVVGIGIEFANQRSFAERYVKSSPLFGLGGCLRVVSGFAVAMRQFVRRVSTGVHSELFGSQR